MSPIGDALRIRCRKYPALVNCCTIDWFFPWPEEALITVASAILENFQNLPSYEKIPKRS
jgi:dynein heavy chain